MLELECGLISHEDLKLLLKGSNFYGVLVLGVLVVDLGSELLQHLLY